MRVCMCVGTHELYQPFVYMHVCKRAYKISRDLDAHACMVCVCMFVRCLCVVYDVHVCSSGIYMYVCIYVVYVYLCMHRCFQKGMHVHM
jgi:hypothetical protein